MTFGRRGRLTGFNPFDLTKVWPHGDYHRFTSDGWCSDRNPKNTTSPRSEQAAQSGEPRPEESARARPDCFGRCSASGPAPPPDRHHIPAAPDQSAQGARSTATKQGRAMRYSTAATRRCTRPTATAPEGRPELPGDRLGGRRRGRYPSRLRAGSEARLPASRHHGAQDPLGNRRRASGPFFSTIFVGHATNAVNAGGPEARGRVLDQRRRGFGARIAKGIPGGRQLEQRRRRGQRAARRSSVGSSASTGL